MNASPLLMIHGWGANGRIFDLLRPHFTRRETAAPHLPGHGDAPLDGAFSVEAAADALAQSLDAPAHILGWSLGGLTALHLAARHPHKVRSLTLCASFAKLHAAPDYPEGVHKTMFERMVALFGEDYPKYMRQFLELQLLNVADARPMIDAVLPDVVRHGAPAALQQALDAVNQADARPLLASIRKPVLLVYGNKDAITPPRMGEYLAAKLPAARLEVFDKAAHAPFLSHPERFSALVEGFVSGVESGAALANGAAV